MTPATLPHKYGAGTRLSSAYTAGLDGRPHAKHYGGMGSAATKAWLTGRKERDAAKEAEKKRRANAYPKLVTELLKELNDRAALARTDPRNGVQHQDRANAIDALLRDLGEIT